MSMLSQDISEVAFTLHSTGEAVDKACGLRICNLQFILDRNI